LRGFEIVIGMTILVELLSLVPGIIRALDGRLQSAKDKPWERILVSLESVEKLTRLHVKAVRIVTAPILETGDILGTCQNFQRLVNDPDLPTSYGTARGELEAALDFRQFQKGVIRDKLRTVLAELGRFQSVVFMREFDSYNMADVLERAEELWALLPAHGESPSDSRVAELQTQVRKDFTFALESIAGQGQTSFDVPQLLTSGDVVNLVLTWCREWLRQVQRTLYGGRGLNYAVGQLRMEHYR
jgi:hypothetical protein